MYKETENKMEKSIVALESDYATLRAGRANPQILDKVMVDYYGTPTPIGQVGTIAVPEPRMLTVQPWDATILKDIEKAILAADLGLNPNNDGKMLRINFPAPTEERRKELVKTASKRAEEAKVTIRGIRRDAIEKFKTMKKDGEITEDDLKNSEKKIQDITDKFIKEVDEVFAKKEKEILEV